VVRPTVANWARRGLVLGPGDGETQRARHKVLPRVDVAQAREMLSRALEAQHPVIVTGPHPQRGRGHRRPCVRPTTCLSLRPGLKPAPEP
jgi:hypothetical protein